MAITIDEAFVQTFEDSIRHVSQQGESRLENYVTTVMAQSEKHNWEIMGAAAARDKTSARMVSPAGGNGSGAVASTDQLAYSRRVSLAATKDAGEVVETKDIVQMLIDPKAASAHALGMAMKRGKDDVIITAATADALNGDATTTAFTAGQTVGGATTVIALDTILETQELFLSNEVEPDEKKVWVMGPTQQRKLLSLAEVNSVDYQVGKALATGVLPNFLGFDFVLSNRLNVPVAGQIDNLVFTPRGIGLHIADDISAKVGERTDMSFAYQLYTEMTLGAVRVEDAHVVKVHLKDAIA